MAVVAVIAFVALAAFVSVSRETPPTADSVAAPASAGSTSESRTVRPSAAAAPKPVVAFIGDSYTQGAGAEPSSEKWTSQLSAAMNWDERNFGLGGTGYLQTAGLAACGLDTCPNYQATALEAIQDNPSIVVVSGGQNDFPSYAENPVAVQAAIATTFVEIRNALPDVEIIAVGPSTPGETTDAVLGLDKDVRDTAEAFGAQYVSLLDPPVIDPANILPDGAHVNNAGHTAISRRVQSALN